MSEENIINAELEKSQEAAAKDTYSKSDVERMIQERLQHEHAKQARLESQYKATIADLEHKVKSGTATTEEKIQHQHAKIAKEEGEGAGIPPHLLPTILAQHQQAMQFSEKVKHAMEKDKEFEHLAKTGNPIPQEWQHHMVHLPNPAAVLKHLLKPNHKNDHRLLELAAASGDLLAFTRVVNEISEKLDRQVSKPHPSEYEVYPDLSNAGDSSQDFDLKDFIKSKY